MTREPEVHFSHAGRQSLITQTTEYALRAVVYLADQGAPRTTQSIAEQTQVPAGYLSKVMQALGRAGIVQAQRGLHGGFVLSVDPKELTVLEVVSALEPVRRIHACPLGLHGEDLCPLHRKLDEAAQWIEQTFGNTTIADLNNVPRSRKPLCTFPRER